MFFTKITPLLQSCAALVASLSISSDGEITILLTPVLDATQEKLSIKWPALKVPLTLTASAAELDEGFVESLQSYTSSRKSLVQQVEATSSILDAAKIDAGTKAAGALKKGTAKALPAPTKTDSDLVSDDDDDEAVNGNSNIPAASGTPASAATDNLFD